MISIVAIVSWIVIEPRSLVSFEPYIKSELHTIFPTYDIDFESSFVKWNPYQKAISIYIANVAIKDKETDNIVASLPETYFNFSALRFLKGHLLSSDVSVYNPDVHLNLSTLMPAQQGDTENDTTTRTSHSRLLANLYKQLFSSLNNYSSNFSLHGANLYNASFFLHGAHSDTVWHIKEGSFQIDKEWGETQLKAKALIDFSGNAATVKASLIQNEALDFSFEVNNISSSTLSDLLPEQKFSDALSVSGNVSIYGTLNESGTFSHLDFAINKAKGTVNMPELFKEPLSLSEMQTQGHLRVEDNHISITKHSMKVLDTTITLSGEGKHIFDSDGSFSSSPEITASATLDELPVNALDKLWPTTIAIKARNWVIAHIHDGNIKAASASLKLTKDDFDAIARWKEARYREKEIPISKGIFEATALIKGVNINYSSRLPAATDVEATLHFSAHDMVADIHSAKMIKSNISKGEVSISNFWTRPVMLKVDADTQGRVSDYIRFLSANLKGKKHAAILNHIFKAKGGVRGHTTLSLPLVRGITFDDINLAINATTSNVRIPSLYNEHDITKAKFNVVLANKQLSLAGDGIINTLPVRFRYQQSLRQQPYSNFRIVANATATADKLKQLGIADIPYTSQPMNIEASVQETAKKRVIDIKGNLKDTDINISDIGFIKPAGTEATLSARVLINKNKADTKIIRPIKLSGENFSLEGKMTLNGSTLTSLTLNRADYGASNYRLTLANKKNSTDINLSGIQFDASNVNFANWIKPSGTSDKNKSPSKRITKGITANIKLKSLLMKNGATYKNIDGSLDCRPTYCQKIQLFGKIPEPEGFMNVSFTPKGKLYSLLIESDNAGYVFKSLDISQNINKGHLLIDGTTIENNKNQRTTSGIAQITDFDVKKFPLLGKLLTLASFQGIGDLLNNKGISFNNFKAPFTYTDNVITIQNAKSSGASVGITSEGTVNLKDNQLDLSGTIIPAQEINKIISKIPVFGKMITGGEDQGVIATSYSVTGSFDDPKTSVNPLSIFTPGVLRNVFDLFPSSKTPETKTEEPAK